jgi:DNA-binding NarL/FixJ family response regulator
MHPKILIVEDEPIIAADIESTLLKHGYGVCGIAYSAHQALDMIANRNPDLLLLDIAIKGEEDGIDIASYVRKKYDIPFIYITSFSNRATLERAQETLPEGYIVKPFKDKDILAAVTMALYKVKRVVDPKYLADQINSKATIPLTESEIRVVKLIQAGKSNNEIAKELFISVNTVKTHLKHIFEKFNVTSRTALLSKIH